MSKRQGAVKDQSCRGGSANTEEKAEVEVPVVQKKEKINESWGYGADEGGYVGREGRSNRGRARE